MHRKILGNLERRKILKNPGGRNETGLGRRRIVRQVRKQGDTLRPVQRERDAERRDGMVVADDYITSHERIKAYYASCPDGYLSRHEAPRLFDMNVTGLMKRFRDLQLEKVLECTFCKSWYASSGSIALMYYHLPGVKIPLDENGYPIPHHSWGGGTFVRRRWPHESVWFESDNLVHV